MRRTTLSVLILALILMIGATSAHAASNKVKPGDIPGITGGELLKLVADNKGKVIVVNVFASWCPPCREEIPGLINIRRAFPEDQVLLVGVSVDKEPKALAAYMSEMRINYPVYLGKGDFIPRMKVTAVPQLLIYNKAGDLPVNHRGLVDEADLKRAVSEFLAE